MSGTRSRKQEGQQRSAQKRKRPAGNGKRKSLFARITAPVDRLITFLRDVRVEMNRVVWPGKEETYTYTLVVVVAVVVVAAWVGLWDTLFVQLVGALNLYE